MSIKINTTKFNARLKQVVDALNNLDDNDDYASLAETSAIYIPNGERDPEDETVRKTSAFQTWLLGYEFPSTVLLITKTKAYVICSAKKAKILSQVAESQPPIPVDILIHNPKDSSTNQIEDFAKAYAEQTTVGHLPKETPVGKLIDDIKKAVDAIGQQPEPIDCAPAIASLLSVKDDHELKNVRTGATLNSTILAHYIATRLETILDKETTITHEQLAGQIEGRLGSGEGDTAKGPDMRVWDKGGKALQDVDWDSVEFTYTPIIQSRSSKSGFDLKPSAQSSSDNMAHKGVFLVSVGMRYKGFCTNLGRTFIVDPTKEQESNYALLTQLMADILGKMKDGAVIKDVYNHALSVIREKKPDLESHFVKNIGWGMGQEFRDIVYSLSGKNTRTLKSGMIFNLIVGFSDLADKDGSKYALQICETVRITADKAISLTEGLKSSKDVMFYLNSGSDDEKKSKPRAPPKAAANGLSPSKHKTAGGKVLRGKTRSAAQQEVAQSNMTKLIEHQRFLHEERFKTGLEKYSEEGAGGGNKEGKTWKRFQSYKGEGGLPKEAESQRIYVDRKAQTVIVPIHGFAVPFHINTIKNVSKNDEGDFTYLRINFQTPGQLAGKKEDTPFEDPDATFIRSVTYRSTDGHRFDQIKDQITNLKREANKRDQQKKEMADVIEQDILLEVKNRRPIKLPEVFVRPATDGKRLPGEVEIHQNGLRYISPLGQKIELLFGNIKHLFFQPCDHELIVILHIHLKAPIMIGKKKAKDVQFYREASDVQFDETGNRKRKYRYGDEDEIELEQQERRRRQQLNKEFKLFSDKVAEAASASTGDTLEVDIPYRELSFEGVPYRTNVRLQPTTDCLVHLVDTPFLVVTLAEIEIASLERVVFGLKQFDMVLIFKDFARPPLQINSIPSSQLDDVKNWLDSVDIPIGENPVNLNWGPIMKTVNESPHDFFMQGGWRSFLRLDTGQPGSDDSDASSSESEFAGEEDSESEESEVESAYSEAATDSDASASDFDDDDGSDGDDWDELERKAAKSDKKRVEEGRGFEDSDDDDRPKKKKSATNGKANTNGKAKPKGKR